MITLEAMKPWIIEALEATDGKAWPKDVARYIWEKYRKDLENSGDVLYTWQYDLRWAAQKLRLEGIMKAVDGKRNKPWELSCSKYEGSFE
ncbi:hypothetical protein [Wohlfahrtiimonas populi]|uniref:hypothetical protein n=1 Tax=Wohlfahrtiimonas populi TaxID=1940240 RepID=UPI00098D3286|nr:hypothetical protein [Wohlfahrtiimonas populi]